MLGGAAVLALDLRPQPLEMWVLTAGVVTMAAALVCWWGARREAERRDALKAMLGLESGGAAPGSSMSDLAAAVIARLARAEAAFAALEHQHLQVLDASIALQAERRRYLRADRGRAASDVLLAAVVRDLPAALVVLDPRGRVCVWSAHAAQLLGVDAPCVRGVDFVARWVAPGDRVTLAAALGGARVAADPLELSAEIHPTGRAEFQATVRLAVVATPRGDYVALTLRDRSAAERAANELALAQRLESVGRLAAGIAHEINTPLQFLASSLEYLQQAAGVDLFALVDELATTAEGAAPPEERAAAAAQACARRALGDARRDLPAALEHAQQGLARVTEIVRSMRLLARGQQRSHVPADLNRALEGTMLLVASALRGRATLRPALAPVPLVACDIGELSQVFVNLICNAADAIEDAGKHGPSGGTIRVATAAPPGEVVVEISDDGGGIPPAVQEHMFEPFFTTKDVGRGTGQGLAIVRSVVERHRGVIEVETAVGVGTTIRIRLPTEEDGLRAGSP